MALVSKTFSELATLTRSTTATYFDSSGILQTSPNNTPRFEYDPSTFVPKGLLIEPSGTNVFTFSEQFENSAWSKLRSSIISNVTSSPSGVLSADRLVEDTSNQTHPLFRSPTLSSNTTYTFSVFVKSSGRNFVRLSISANVVSPLTIDLDLTSGNFTTTDPLRTSIKTCSNGWFRISGTVTAVSSVAGTTLFFLYPCISLGNNIYLGDGTSGLYVWGAQMETSITSTSYIPTTVSSNTRSNDVLFISSGTGWQGNSTDFNIDCDVGVSSSMNSSGITVSGNGFVRSISYSPNE